MNCFILREFEAFKSLISSDLWFLIFSSWYLASFPRKLRQCHFLSNAHSYKTFAFQKTNSNFLQSWSNPFLSRLQEACKVLQKKQIFWWLDCFGSLAWQPFILVPSQRTNSNGSWNCSSYLPWLGCGTWTLVWFTCSFWLLLDLSKLGVQVTFVLVWFRLKCL